MVEGWLKGGCGVAELTKHPARFHRENHRFGVDGVVDLHKTVGGQILRFSGRIALLLSLSTYPPCFIETYHPNHPSPSVFV